MPNSILPKNLFFLVYDSRSGSTLLSSHLDAYEDIDVSIESNFMRAILVEEQTLTAFNDTGQMFDHLVALERIRNLQLDKETFRNYLANCTETTPASIARALIAAQTDLDQQTLVTKAGIYGLWINQIHAILPDAKYIHLIRDGRAVYNSKAKTQRPYAPGKLMARDPVTAYRQWKTINQRIFDFGRQEPEKILHIRYEDYVRSPETHLSKIRMFMGLPPCKLPANSGYGDKIPSQEVEIHPLIQQGCNPGRIDAWQEESNRNDILTYDFLANKLLQRWGYCPLHADSKYRQLPSMGILKVLARSLALRLKDWLYTMGTPKRLKRILTSKQLSRRG